MLGNRTRALLDRYALASRALSRLGGDRSAFEAGQSVEFHDFREYQPGDELRYVDWRVYARTGRLYTRLYQAERAVSLHIVLDTSASMALHGKAAYARTAAQLLTYVAQRDAPTQLHLLDGRSSRPAQGRIGMRESWRFVDEAPQLTGATAQPLSALKRFALALPSVRGNALVLVISDLLEDVPFQPTLAALRARGVDVGFLQTLASAELDPPLEQLELHDVESADRLAIGPTEARAYREEVRGYVARTRAAVLKAGFKHLLLSVPPGAADTEATERSAFAGLVSAGVLTKR